MRVGVFSVGGYIRGVVTRVIISGYQVDFKFHNANYNRFPTVLLRNEVIKKVAKKHTPLAFSTSGDIAVVVGDLCITEVP